MLVDRENELELDHLSFRIIWNNLWFGIDVNGDVKMCFWLDEISYISWLDSVSASIIACALLSCW